MNIANSPPSLMDCLPKGMRGTADWVFVLKDGEELPCHSQPLCSLSPVLAVNVDLKPRKGGRVAIPFTRGRDVANAFLRWTYRLKFTLTPLLAKELAYLGDEWNIPGRVESYQITASASSYVISEFLFAEDCVTLHSCLLYNIL
jgi:hypothetical protein